MIAEFHASPTRDNRLEGNSLSFIRPLIYDDLAFAVSRFDFAGEYAHQRPIQARQRRAVEMTVNDSSDIGKQTISVGGWLIKLTSAAHGTITVIVGIALEFPIIMHVVNLFPLVPLTWKRHFEINISQLVTEHKCMLASLVLTAFADKITVAVPGQYFRFPANDRQTAIY